MMRVTIRFLIPPYLLAVTLIAVVALLTQG